jgi:hypothetical protein
VLPAGARPKSPTASAARPSSRRSAPFLPPLGPSLLLMTSLGRLFPCEPIDRPTPTVPAPAQPVRRIGIVSVRPPITLRIAKGRR